MYYNAGLDTLFGLFLGQSRQHPVLQYWREVCLVFWSIFLILSQICEDQFMIVALNARGMFRMLTDFSPVLVHARLFLVVSKPGNNISDFLFFLFFRRHYTISA